jgi:hypothetical protein
MSLGIFPESLLLKIFMSMSFVELHRFLGMEPVIEFMLSEKYSKFTK